jgi:predicted dehydrogenase
MKQLVDEGRVGTVRLLRASWLSDEFLNPEVMFDWRFERSEGGSTAADLGAHLIDLAAWMVGDVTAVAAQSEIFTRVRRDPVGGGDRQVDVEEACSALMKFDNGALGVFETAKVCPSRPCDFTLEVNGSLGTLRFEYARLNELWYGSADGSPELYGMVRIRAEHPAHPETAGWWPMGQGIGYGASFVNQAADLLQRWPDGPWAPNMMTGLKVQAVCEAIERASAERRWVAVSEVAHAAV